MKNRSNHGNFGLKRTVALAVVPALALATAMVAAGPTTAAPAHLHRVAALDSGARYLPNQVLVRFRPGTTAATQAQVNRAIGAVGLQSFTIVPQLRLLRVPASLSVPAAVAFYQRQDSVLYAQPNWISHIDGAAAPTRTDKTPNDPRYGEQWDWPKIGAPAAWSVTTGKHSIVVTDIDTGMDYNHEDLKANAWLNTAECNGVKGKDDDHNGYVDDCHGIDPIDGDTDPIDDAGHGTHTAGTIGAVGNNGKGVTGFNWTVQVMPCKSHNSSGNGSVASIIACYQYARTEKVKYGYNVVSTNNSYGSCPEACDYNPATYDALAAEIKPGIIMSFAAGNAARDNDIRPNYPSNYDLPNVIAVAATDASDNLASFSEWGLRSVDVGAPGVSVLSTIPNNGYGFLSGTSMAAPHVAGLVALLTASDSTLAWWKIRNLIIAGGDAISSLKGKTVSGRRINANGSMTCRNKAVFGMLAPVATTGAMRQTVEALNIDCAKPAGGVKVTIKPGNVTLTLLDDGKGADLVAGDGIYAAAWNPVCPGDTYTFTFSNGKSYTVKVVACAKVNPASGPPGTSVKVTGSGYSASEIVDVFFDHKMVATVNADSTGHFSATFKVPSGAKAGKHVVTASGQNSGLAATATFKVT